MVCAGLETWVSLKGNGFGSAGKSRVASVGMTRIRGGGRGWWLVSANTPTSAYVAAFARRTT